MSLAQSPIVCFICSCCIIKVMFNKSCSIWAARIYVRMWSKCCKATKYEWYIMFILLYLAITPPVCPCVPIYVFFSFLCSSSPSSVRWRAQGYHSNWFRLNYVYHNQLQIVINKCGPQRYVVWQIRACYIKHNNGIHALIYGGCVKLIFRRAGFRRMSVHVNFMYSVCVNVQNSQK